jgi:hypothetical protein
MTKTNVMFIYWKVIFGFFCFYLSLKKLVNKKHFLINRKYFLVNENTFRSKKTLSS